jgi:membrane protein YdbS with pleckstrin-like domain
MSLSPLRRQLDPVSQYVLPTEQIEVSRRLHWSVVIEPFFSGLGSLFIAGYLTGQMPDRTGPLDDIIWFAALAMIARLIWRVAQWNSDRFIVTGRRVMLVTGVFNRRVAMMPLQRVTDMTYHRSVAGRIFGWGTFVIESAGQDQALRTIDRLPSPDALYQTVCMLMFGSEHQGPPPRVRVVQPLPEAEIDEQDVV